MQAKIHHFNTKEIEQMDRKVRLNLINSIGGIKPANLIGTISPDGKTNLAVFFSVIHLQSQPPLLGFMLRPDHEVRRDTWENIKSTHYFTVNSIHTKISKKAHYTSAKLPPDMSEFDYCGFKEEYIDGFPAPYVAESAIKIGLKWVDDHFITLSKTRLVVGEIQHIYLPEEALDSHGYIDLELLESAGLGGLNNYYSVKKHAEYPYVRLDDKQALTL